MMLFSERIGVRPARSVQVDTVDMALRTALWNVLLPQIKMLDQLPRNAVFAGIGYSWAAVAKVFWVDLFNKPGDELPKVEALRPILRKYFFECAWYEAYDFLEVFLRASPFPDTSFAEQCNAVLRREASGYRLMGKRIVPLTSESEIAGIEEALAATQASDPLRLVNNHLGRALALFSDRRAPDYRNSMKEAISAVECLSKLITKNERGTLGQMLTAIEARGIVKLHKSLVEAFRQLYNYTSDSDGIRHALKDEPTVDVEDARFMLVSCAGFINYALAKLQKAGITL